MQRIFANLFGLLCCLWLTAAEASDAQICEDLSALQRAGVQLQSSGGVENTAAVRAKLTGLSQRLRGIRNLNSKADSGSRGDALGMVVAALDRAVARSNAGAELAGQLRSLQTDFQLLSIVFECRTDTSTSGPDPKTLASGDAPGATAGATLSQLTRSPIAVGGGITLVLMVIAAVAARQGLKGRARRLMCNTPVLVDVKDGCTITKIIDINRYGMKIESAPTHAANMIVDLYFCGHHQRGKIMWSNRFFAGVQFQKRISQAALNEVIKKSRSSIDESGLAQNATPCFHTGCHDHCKKLVQVLCLNARRWIARVIAKRTPDLLNEKAHPFGMR